jgi:hypothetical protein
MHYIHKHCNGRSLHAYGNGMFDPAAVMCEPLGQTTNIGTKNNDDRRILARPNILPKHFYILVHKHILHQLAVLFYVSTTTIYSSVRHH